MLTKAVVYKLFIFFLLCPVWLPGQEPPATSSVGRSEFPVLLQQSITAGKTLVGTKVRAKLEVATLVDGTVLPRGTVFSGEVTESVAKSKTDPSRLAIRMDSAQWKNGSANVKVYVTAWYYPARDASGQDLQYGPKQPDNRTWNGEGQYPDPNSKVYKPFPSDSDKRGAAPDTTGTVPSNHRALMKNVESERGQDGAIAIVCKHSNLKLDKLTVYVLAGNDLIAGK
jgi:hypothetical protein